MYFKPEGDTCNRWQWDDMAKWLEGYREKCMATLRSEQTDHEIHMRKAACERFSSSIISYLWQPGGRPFSDEE